MAEDKSSTTDSGTPDSKASESPAPAPGIHRGKSIPADQWGDTEVIIEEPKELQAKSAMREEIEAASLAAQTPEASKDEGNADEESEEAPENETEDSEDDTNQEDAVAEDTTRYVEDPGEFQPGDYSFDVTVFNDKGERPRSVKISSIDAWEKLLEDEPNLGSSVAVNKAFRAAQKMELNLERDHQQWSEAKAEYEEAEKTQEQYQSSVQNVANEMNYLASRGNLPKLTQEEQSLNWYQEGTQTPDAAVLKAHPNIKPWVDLVLYMRRESNSRTRAGLQPLTSAIDAFNAMQLDTRSKADNETKQRQAEARKEAGAKVSSAGTTPLSAAVPSGIKVGRNLGSLQRMGQNWN